MGAFMEFWDDYTLAEVELGGKLGLSVLLLSERAIFPAPVRKYN